MEYNQGRYTYFEPLSTPDTIPMSFNYEDMYRSVSFEQEHRSSSATESQWPSPTQNSPTIPSENARSPRAKPKRTSHPAEQSSLKSEVLEPTTLEGVSKERRRKKNRQAQAAFRERQKKVIDDLRHDVMRHVQYNQLLKRKMYEMLTKMELMKMGFEEALALEPQLTSADFLRTGVLELQSSPAPSSEASHGSFWTGLDGDGR